MIIKFFKIIRKLIKQKKVIRLKLNNWFREKRKKD